jgi:hypothetical protein
LTVECTGGNSGHANGGGGRVAEFEANEHQVWENAADFARVKFVFYGWMVL